MLSPISVQRVLLSTGTDCFPVHTGIKSFSQMEIICIINYSVLYSWHFSITRLSLLRNHCVDSHSDKLLISLLWTGDNGSRIGIDPGLYFELSWIIRPLFNPLNQNLKVIHMCIKFWKVLLLRTFSSRLLHIHIWVQSLKMSNKWLYMNDILKYKRISYTHILLLLTMILCYHSYYTYNVF